MNTKRNTKSVRNEVRDIPRNQTALLLTDIMDLSTKNDLWKKFNENPTSMTRIRESIQNELEAELE